MAGETFHGWKVEHSENATGKPRITLTKPDRVTLWIDRRVGVDAEVALQRVKVDALQQDLAASSPDDRDIWQKRLDTAIQERDMARAQRVAQAAVAQQFQRGDQ